MKRLFSLAVVLAICCAPIAGSADAEEAAAIIGKKVANFVLKDQSGKAVSLEGLKDKKAVVVVFAGTECPINNAYMAPLAKMATSYASRQVQFLAINSNRQDTAERIAAHARENATPFPVLKDEGNRVADDFGAQRTPEAFVLDGERRIRYHGGIDDQFGIGYKRPAPTTRDMLNALDAVLEGKTVAVTSTPIAGCIIARVSKPKEVGRVTYAKEVSRIMQAKCQVCHRPGEVGPMSLLSYDDAVAWSDTIREVLKDNRMPPWHADPRYGHFRNDRRLSDGDRETLLTWLDEGTPKGDDKDLPPPREFVKGWAIGKPDIVFQMPEEYHVPADMPKNGIPYQRFRVKTNFTEDRWVERAETRPGSPSVVHHIIIWVLKPGEDFIPGNPNTQLLCGEAPGDMPLILPKGMGKKIPAGSDLMFEMHYTPNGTAQTDRSICGLIFAKEPPKYWVLTQGVANDDFRIPPGDSNHEVEQWYRLPQDGYLLNFMPHMHLRGKDFKYTVHYPDGKSEVLLSIPRYDFNWQSAYRESTPLFMPKGTKIHCLAHFDNSKSNANNPDPAKTVTWGDQTWEEMMIGWMDFAFPVAEKKVASRR
jgi:peroxiredoxin